jgi:hypothetical protein
MSVLACLSLSQENRFPAGKPIQKYRLNQEDLSTATDHYHKKENVSLLWK